MCPAIWCPSGFRPGWLSGRIHRWAHRTTQRLRTPHADVQDRIAEFDARFFSRYAEYEPRIKVTRYD